MNPRTRSGLVLLTLVAAVGASIASSSPSAGGDISGGDGPFNVHLDADSPDSSASIEALLETTGTLGEAGGEVGLSVTFAAGSSGQVRSSVTSLATGATNEHDVFDPDAEQSFRIAIPAFEGCAGTSCGETFEVRFERLEADVTNALSLEWSVDGVASVVEAVDGEAPDGTLTFTVEP